MRFVVAMRDLIRSCTACRIPNESKALPPREATPLSWRVAHETTWDARLALTHIKQGIESVAFARRGEEQSGPGPPIQGGLSQALASAPARHSLAPPQREVPVRQRKMLVRHRARARALRAGRMSRRAQHLRQPPGYPSPGELRQDALTAAGSQLARPTAVGQELSQGPRQGDS